MNRNGPLPEVSDLILAGGPVDLNTAAVNGRWVRMSDVAGLNAILIAAVGTAGDDPVISLEQATDSSGTGAKALSIYKLHYKIGSTAIDAADDVWVEDTAIDRDNGAASWDSDSIAGAENVLMVNVYILPQDLDINNDFKYVRLNVADVGANAQLGVLLYLADDIAYKGSRSFSLLT